jgi:hypothetical protein
MLEGVLPQVVEFRSGADNRNTAADTVNELVKE